MSGQGPVAVITGGASGIGFATAAVLAERGYRLVLADIEQARLAEATEALGERAEVLGQVTDVTDRASVVALADATLARFGRVDVVFNNAGVATVGEAVTMSHDDWTWLVNVNLWGPIHGVEVFLPRLVEQGEGGHLLFTASFAGLVPNIGLAPYCVTKYGVVALAEVLHRELRPHRIGVSVLCPMRVETDINRSERNRPAALGGAVAAPLVAHQDPANEERAGRVIPVEGVAELAADAIGTRRLYLVPHEESRESIRRRFARIDAAFDE